MSWKCDGTSETIVQERGGGGVWREGGRRGGWREGEEEEVGRKWGGVGRGGGGGGGKKMHIQTKINNGQWPIENKAKQDSNNKCVDTNSNSKRTRVTRLRDTGYAWRKPSVGYTGALQSLVRSRTGVSPTTTSDAPKKRQTKFGLNRPATAMHKALHRPSLFSLPPTELLPCGAREGILSNMRVCLCVGDGTRCLPSR